MGTINYGNQIINFDYKQPATSESFNNLSYNIIPRGIYEGGLLSRVDDTTINISPLVCFIQENTHEVGVKVETTTTASIIISNTIPFIIIRFLWVNTSNNYADIMGVAETDIGDNDIIIGKCNYSGTVLSSTFDYYRRGIVPIENYRFKKTYNITDAVDITINLPDAQMERGERTYQRTGAGAGKIVFTTVNSQTINGVIPSNWNLTNNPETIILKPEDGNWIVVNSFKNSWKNNAYIVRVFANRSVQKWNTQVSAADNYWRGVTWSPELGLFCAVAYSGVGNRVMTSSDGVNWVIRVSAADNYWTSVTWSPELGLFCAVATSGTGNRVMTSSDGINWIIRVSAADNGWNGVTWSPELGLFCAVAITGTGNRVMTSSDGVNWVIRVSAADNQWYGVTWSPELGLFCAVAYSGVGNRVMTSNDGVNWTIRSSAADNGWIGVTWSPELGLFCAVAISGTGNRVMTSSDGVNWVIRVSAADNNWYSVTWSPELGLFCAVAITGTGNRVMTSSDGINWIIRVSAADNNWTSVTWSPELGLFCTVAASGVGNRVMINI